MGQAKLRGRPARKLQRRAVLPSIPVARGVLEFLEHRVLFSTYGLNSIVAFPATNNGSAPLAGLVADASGNLFGVSSLGGADNLGAVFEIVKNSGFVTPLASFTGVNGSDPEAALVIDASGNLFGTARGGGANAAGVVFEVVHGSGTVSVLASFDGNNGAVPSGTLVADPGGNLFGTASSGGPAGVGTIFEIVHGTHTITRLASFDGINGANPVGNLARDSAGNLFGATASGGATNDGTVFELPAGSGTITVIASLNAGTVGGLSSSGITLDAGGNLFGSTTNDPSGNGTVFEIVHNTTAVNVLATFNGSNGSGPDGGLIVDASGNVYGTTTGGGSGASTSGTVFEIATGSGVITTLASFDGKLQGSTPNGNLVRDTSGNLFGTAYGNGAGGAGTVFEVVAGSGTVTPLAALSTSPGAVPYSDLTPDSSGNLFGTTSTGGSGNGTVFEYVKSTGAVVTVATFSGIDGSDPEGKLAIDALGNLFGTTVSGGANGAGSVFEIVKNSGAVTTLASFSISDGANPGSGVVIDTARNLFGVASAGGTGDGVLFEVVKNSNAITDLHQFNGTDGLGPLAGLAFDPTGNLYGTTFGDGVTSLGTVFKYVVGSATFSTIASFNGTVGSSPAGPLTVTAAGDIFGTAQTGGNANGDGTVWKIVHNTSSIIDLGNFNSATTGANPRSGVYVDTAGNLFGTATNGGSTGLGTVWKLSTAGALTAVATFAGTNGAHPQAGLYADGTGNFFGTTTTGGAGAGTVYEIANASTTITRLFSFGPTNGVNPASALIADTAGNLFGTTPAGGVAGSGTVFEIVAGSHVVTTRASFTGANGSTPLAALLLDGSGNLFGTTSLGGANGVGSVFEIVSGSNAITTLASFNTTNGANPSGKLAIDSSGNLYGTAAAGGAGSAGVVFEVVKNSNTITDLAAFNTSNGANPVSDVTIDASGNLFGVARTGGLGFGTVFKVVKNSNAITVLATFIGTSQGANPSGGVVVDVSGNVFGTTAAGGTYSNGTVFKVAIGSGVVTSLASFDGVHGASPVGTLVIDGSGNLVGTTPAGGDSGLGTVFEVVAGSNSITNLISFSGLNGERPRGGLLLDSNGNLFGTTFAGGYASSGTVFELVPATVQVGAYIDSTSPPAVLHVQIGPATTTNITLQADANPLSVDVLAGSVIIGTFPLASFSSVVIDADSNNDSITLNLGVNLGTRPVTIEGGTGIDTLNVIGTTGNDTITANATTLTVNSTPVSFSNIAVLKIDPLGGTDSLTISSGSVEIPANTSGGLLVRQFSNLTIAGGAKLMIDPAASTTSRTLLVTAGLSIDPAGKLDLTGNDLLVHNGIFSTISQRVTSGFASGLWTGPGIDSSSANADPRHLTVLGAIVNNTGSTATVRASFDGQTAVYTDVLVKYTYYGDANLDGTVDGSDYTKIDAGFGTPLTGWLNGDFNYDTKIDGSDYTLIDNAFNTQGVTMASQIAAVASAGSALAAVPTSGGPGVATRTSMPDNADRTEDRRKLLESVGL